MNAYCQSQFSTFAVQERCRQRQKELRQQQRDLRASLLEVMRQQNLKNVQVEGPNGSRLQVKLSRYPVPRVITQELLDEATIDWNAAFKLTVDDQIEYIVAEIKKVARDTRPYVDVTECGKRSRDRLRLVGGAASRQTGGEDPFTDAATRLAEYKAELRKETQAMDELVGAKHMKEAAAAVLQEMAQVGIRKKPVNLRSSDGTSYKFVVERKVEHRRPPVTVKVIMAAVKAALAEHARHPKTSDVIKQWILDYISDATQPVPHESLHFWSAKKDGGAAAALCGDDDDGDECDDDRDVDRDDERDNDRDVD